MIENVAVMPDEMIAGLAEKMSFLPREGFAVGASAGTFSVGLAEILTTKSTVWPDVDPVMLNVSRSALTVDVSRNRVLTRDRWWGPVRLLWTKSGRPNRPYLQVGPASVSVARRNCIDSSRRAVAPRTIGR